MKPERLSYHSDDERRAFCLSKGIDPSEHCCLDMAWFIAEPVETWRPNPTMLWIQQWNEYRINIPLGGHTSVPVYYCPWCGKRLPESLQEQWYDRLYELGYNDPGEDEIPPEFDTDAWWRKSGS